MSHLSYSQVDTLLSCGEKYRLTRVVGIPEDPAWWLIGGTAVHSATEAWDRGAFDATAADLFTESFDYGLSQSSVEDLSLLRASGRATKDYPNGEDETWWRDNGPKFVQAWIDWRAANPNLQILDLNGRPAIEVSVGALTADQVELKGFIDRVFVDATTGDLLIVDLKTGRNTPPSSLQMDYYRYALQSTLGLQAHYGAYWMARQGTLSTIHHLWRSDEQIADMLRKARILIDNELYIPHLSILCGSCGVKQHCTAYTNLNSINNGITEEMIA